MTTKHTGAPPRRKATTLRARRAAEQARTTLAKQKYLIEHADYGIVARSAVAAGVSRGQVYVWRETDPVFVEAEKDALINAGELLEQEATRRGRVGWIEPVYQLGQRVGFVRKYSDHLLTQMMKAKVPERHREVRELTGKGGKDLFQAIPIQQMSTADLIRQTREDLAILEAAAEEEESQKG